MWAKFERQPENQIVVVLFFGWRLGGFFKSGVCQSVWVTRLGKRLQFAIENGPVEIVDLAMNSMGGCSIGFLLTFTRPGI